MLQTRRRNTLKTIALAVAFGLVASLGLSLAQDFPSRPINLVVPQSAGGGFDLTARAVSSVVPDHLGQPAVVRIRPGAGTTIGTLEVINSDADGHTLLFGGNHALALGQFQDLPFDPVEDLIPVAQLGDWSWWLIVPNSSPFNTAEELIEYASDNPGALTFANAGSLTVAQLPAFELEMHSGIQVTHLPFDGGGPTNLAVMGGQVDGGFAVTPWAVPNALSGNVKVLAVTGTERHPDLPDVPTFEELGYPIHTTLWTGVYAPAGTPEENVQILEEAFAELAENPTYQRLIESLGDRVQFLDREAFGAKIDRFAETAGEVADTLREQGVVD